ncbi:flavodoxin [Paenibacillus sp. 1P07SE]|uniref:flavodoxin n=1 Tax=Paenibacillus sp. 1P07SE TaxID=3132209 RepID=UPI0039A547D9
MADVIIIYASMTGNTEEMAEAIAEGVRAGGGEPLVKSVMDASAVDLASYRGIILGAYTWGDGELPDEFLDFYEEMDEVRLDGCRCAVFGSADSSYPEFGAAVDLLAAKLQQCGAALVQEGLKIELSPSSQEKQDCVAYGKRFAAQLAAETAIQG